MFRNALMLALALPLLSAATPAPNAPPETVLEAMQLSSWQSEIVDGVMVGGSQSVTIVSTSTDATPTMTFPLGEPPCDCSLTTASASVGILENGVWLIGDLPVGATVTLDLQYTVNS